jgi:hypothetical protein
MGDTVDIILERWQRVITLPKQVIYDYAPESLLAQAVEGDPNAKEIRIENPVVTPEAIELLLNYSHGREPEFANTELGPAANYLNIPWLHYYAEPLYSVITRPSQKIDFETITGQPSPILTNAEATNWPVFVQAFDQRRPLVLGYLLSHGFDATGALQEAFREGREDMVRYLLTQPGIDVAAKDELLILAAAHGFTNLIKDLLTQPGVNPRAQDYKALIEAARNGHAETIQTLLRAVPDYPPVDLQIDPLYQAARSNPLVGQIVLGYYGWQRLPPSPQKDEFYRNGFVGYL